MTADLAKVVNRSNIFSNQAGEQQPQNSGGVMTNRVFLQIECFNFVNLRVSILSQVCLHQTGYQHFPFNVSLTMLRRPLDHVLSMYHQCTQTPNPILMKRGVGVGQPGYEMPDTFDEWVHAWVEKPREDYEARIWENMFHCKNPTRDDQPPTAVLSNEPALCHHQHYRCHQCAGVHQLCGHRRGIS